MDNINLQKKKEWLKMHADLGAEIVLHHISTEKVWRTVKPYSECTEVEIGEANLRKLFGHYEVVLDVDDPSKLDIIRAKLKEKNWKYMLFSTGSRGYHILLYFPELVKYDIYVRNSIRKKIIREFNCDEAKSSELGLLGLEYAPSFKTGRTKELLEGEWIKNTLPPILIENVLRDVRTPQQTIIKIPDERYIDFVEKDPLIKWALLDSTIITDGGRNDILFKNLAVALVLSGKNDEEIRSIASIIVEHCPGKNINEFFGWVKKVRAGQLIDYNRAEINAWCRMYNHPVLYEEVKGQDIITEKLTIKQLWNELWSQEITAQDEWRDLLYYNIVGTVLDERDADLRVHIIFTSPAGSGKDTGVDIAKNVFKELGVAAVDILNATDRALVGSEDKYAHEYNMKHHLNEGETRASRGEVLEYQPEVRPGILQDKLWIACTEAEFIFKPGLYNKELQAVLRMAMDKDRHITRFVGHSEIDIYTNTSFVLTTYGFNINLSMVLTNGLFQRVFFYDKKESEELHNAIMQRNISRSPISSPVIQNITLRQLATKLAEMKTWFNGNRHRFVSTFEYSTLLMQYMNEYEQRFINDLTEENKFVLKACVRRSIININKVIILNAIANFREPNEDDVKLAFKLATSCLECIKQLCMGASSDVKRMTVLTYILSQQPGRQLPAMQLWQRAGDVLGLSKESVMSLVRKTEKSGLIQSRKSGKYKIYYILPEQEDSEE